MKKIKNIKALSLGTSAALILSVASGAVQASDANPFGMEEMAEGYNVAMSEGMCGEGKSDEGKCGGDKSKGAAGEAGKTSEGKCGEGKSTEGKCGGSKAKK